MGCDIHMYPETRSKSERGSWWQICDSFYCGRDYWMFGVLAGVRMGTALFEPRGVPSDASWGTRNENERFVVEGEPQNDGEVSRASAERWGGNYADAEKTRVFHPDWHSQSWLTLVELEKCCKQYEMENERPPPPEYLALVAMMESLEQRGQETRIVFWFDN